MNQARLKPHFRFVRYRAVNTPLLLNIDIGKLFLDSHIVHYAPDVAVKITNKNSAHPGTLISASSLTSLVTTCIQLLSRYYPRRCSRSRQSIFSGRLFYGYWSSYPPSQHSAFTTCCRNSTPFDEISHCSDVADGSWRRSGPLSANIL